jgi:hypothetical protein
MALIRSGAEVLKSSSGPAINDMYGKLYYYLLDLVSSFYDRLSSLNVGFEIHNTDATDLAARLKDGTFARIEVNMPHVLLTCSSQASC